MNRRLMIALLALGVALVVAAGVVYVVFVLQNSKPKPPEITLPPSLGDWAEDYPHLADILNDPELGSVYKEFLVVYEEEGEGAALELARERGILIAEEGVEYIYLILILDTEDNAALKTQLEELGAKVFSAHRDRMSVGVPVEMVRQQLATGEAGAVFGELTEIEHVIAVRLPEPMIPDGSAIDGEGIGVIDADAWHDAGITGRGLKVAVLDGGFWGYEDLLGEELPETVTFVRFGPDRTAEMPDAGKVHGTACAEIVHEIAPEAELFLVQFGDETSWANALDYVAEQDVDVVSHSYGWAVGPRDGTSWFAEQVDDLVTTHGVLWVNAAGNDALSHYRAVFTDSDGDGLHDFAPGVNAMAIYNQGYVRVFLQWDDDWERPTQDYQLHVVDGDGNVLASSTNIQSGELGQEPVEWLMGSTDGEIVYVAVEASRTDAPVTIDIFAPKLQVEYPVPERSITIPSDGRGSLTVGAVNWDDDSLANYSSLGPTEDERLKPEISAPTKVRGASYGALGARFTGTSAACPHVAGAAALIWQANPSFTRLEVVGFMLDNAVDLGPDGPDTGYGLGRLELPEPAIGPTSEPTVAPLPTNTPLPTTGPTATPGLTSTALPINTPSPVAPNTSEPEPTQVAYVQPTSVPSLPPDMASGTLVVGAAVFVVAGLGCGGVALLLVGGVGLIVLGRRGRRAQPIPQPVPSLGPRVPPLPPLPSQSQAVRCQHCGAVVRPGARFCPSCGQAAAPTQCPHCGAALRAGGRFCPRCGRPAW
jgi:subtilisin family serine protease